MDLLEVALQSPVCWSSAFFLSGDSYPIKSLYQIEKKLQCEWPTNYFREQGVKPVLVEHKTNSRVPKDWQGWEIMAPGASVYWGTQWVTITREFAHYAVTSSHAKALYQAFSRVLLDSDLLFFIFNRYGHQKKDFSKL